MTQLASDNFTRANSTGLGANWSNNTAENSISFDIASDLAIPHAVGSGGISMIYSGISWGNDQYSETTLGGSGSVAPDVGSGVICRCVLSGSVNYYLAVASASGWTVGKFVANSYTQFGQSATPAFAIGDSLRLELQGTTWRVKKNLTLITSGTDSSFASGSPGIIYADTAASTASAALSLWAGGDFSAGGPPASQFFLGVLPLVSPLGALDWIIRRRRKLAIERRKGLLR